MGRILFLILVLASVCLVSFCGCQKAEQSPARASVDGIKLKDLEPVDPGNLPPQIRFRIFRFEVHTDWISSLQQGFSQFDTTQLNFAQLPAFQANGFLVGFGTNEHMGGLSILLEKIQARRKETRNLLVYDDAGDDISVAMLNSKKEVSWKVADGKVSKDVFSPGRFSWMLKAAPVPDIRGVAQVRMLPVYRMGTDGFLTYLARMRSYTPFDFGAFDVRMNPGDFVLLGSLGEPEAPAKPAADDQPEAAEADKKPPDLTLNRLLFYPPEKPWAINLYLVLCTGVGD
ncbi:MAG: hypothetical protein J7M40_17220 [Planctomycetes bacterium]|nr:hypothetical protein [Planctomycetota bacterium]